MSYRDSWIPKPRIRKAKTEDFDQAISLFEDNQAYLQHKHGQFFLADLIEASNKDKHLLTLVAEIESQIVGFMCFSTNIDIGSLNRCFFLEKYENFAPMSSHKKCSDGASDSEGSDAAVTGDSETSEKKDSDDIDASPQILISYEHCIALCKNNTRLGKQISGEIVKIFEAQGWKLLEKELINFVAIENEENFVGLIETAYELLSDQQKDILMAKLSPTLKQAAEDEQANETTDDDLAVNQFTEQLTIDTADSQLIKNSQINKNKTVIAATLCCVRTNFDFVINWLCRGAFEYFSKKYMV